MHVQIALFDGFDPLDVVAPFEVLHAGGLYAAGAVTVALASAEGARDVPSGTGSLSLRATELLETSRADVILVPGASGRVDDSADDDDSADGDDTIPKILGRTLETRLPDILREACADPDLIVATVCGGSLVLAMAGLIEGRHAVTHHLGMDLLDATGVVAVDARVVDDGDLVTAAGVTSGLDLALYLLEPESDDGIVTYTLFDPVLKAEADFPVIRLAQPLVTR